MRKHLVRKVFFVLKEDYFADFNERTIFLAIKYFVEKYNKPPTKESVLIDLEKDNLDLLLKNSFVLNIIRCFFIEL